RTCFLRSVIFLTWAGLWTGKFTLFTANFYGAKWRPGVFIVFVHGLVRARKALTSQFEIKPRLQ
ncbi:MAG: hypothetical protein ACPG7E_05300, partial [Marinirhabdus sp.]